MVPSLRTLCSTARNSKGFPPATKYGSGTITGGGRKCGNMGKTTEVGGRVSGEGYQFHRTTLANLKKALDANPASIEAANRYWDALGSFGGADVRSGGYLIEAYRRCALASHAGVVALARAYQELFERSGEGPRAELFDEELIRALQTRLPELPNGDRATVQWVLAFIE